MDGDWFVNDVPEGHSDLGDDWRRASAGESSLDERMLTHRFDVQSRGYVYAEDDSVEGRQIPASPPYGLGYGDRKSGFSTQEPGEWIPRLIPATPGVEGDSVGNAFSWARMEIIRDGFDPGLPGTSIEPKHSSDGDGNLVLDAEWLERAWNEWQPESVRPRWAFDYGHVVKGGPKLRDRSDPTPDERQWLREREDRRRNLRKVLGLPDLELQMQIARVWRENNFRICADADCDELLRDFKSSRQKRYCGTPKCDRRRASRRKAAGRKVPANHHVTRSPATAPLVEEQVRGAHVYDHPPARLRARAPAVAA